MEILVSLNNKHDLKNLIDLNISSFLIGLKDLSIYHNEYFDIFEIKELLNNDINLFVSVNKLMHNSDLKHLEETLVELSNLNIKGVLYDDLAVLNIKKRLNLNIPLIFAGSHIVTNYHTINSLDEAVGALLSSEITLDEMIDIKNNTNKLIIAPIFGYQIMTTSKRNFITNYKTYFNIENKETSYHIIDKDSTCKIYEDNNGTHVLSNDVLNGIKDIDKLKIMDYIYLSDLKIDFDIFKQVVQIYKEENNTDKINELIPNNSDLFYHKESYFKVIR